MGMAKVSLRLLQRLSLEPCDTACNTRHDKVRRVAVVSVIMLAPFAKPPALMVAGMSSMCASSSSWHSCRRTWDSLRTQRWTSWAMWSSNATSSKTGHMMWFGYRRLLDQVGMSCRGLHRARRVVGLGACMSRSSCGQLLWAAAATDRAWLATRPLLCMEYWGKRLEALEVLAPRNHSLPAR